MNKLASTLMIAVVGLVVLAAASRPLAGLIHATVPLVVVAGVVAALLRAMWFYTR